VNARIVTSLRWTVAVAIFSWRVCDCLNEWYPNHPPPIKTARMLKRKIAFFMKVLPAP